MTMKIDKANALEKMADQNAGHCPTCHQTIKIYHYSVNKPAATFMRALADAVRDSSVNDTDISTIGLPYSIRTQVTKVRLHGLIARVKDDRGVQIPRRWLITRKGWDFITGKPIPKRVTVYNNQVLGHDEGLATIHSILGEKVNLEAPQYDETPVTPAEARTYDNVRVPKKHIKVRAIYLGRGNFRTDTPLELKINQLAFGKPVEIKYVGEEKENLTYPNIAAFQKAWRVV